MEKWKWLVIGVIMTLAIGGAIFYFTQEEPEPTLWKARPPLWVIDIREGVPAIVRGVPVRELDGGLWVELSFLLDGRVSLLGGCLPPVTAVEGRIDDIRASNSIFLISPYKLEGLKELAQKYPELLPLSYDEIILYQPPFMYAARDEETGMIRVLIIAHRTPESLPRLLVENGVPLETPIFL